jgi:hypothetical protein
LKTLVELAQARCGIEMKWYGYSGTLAVRPGIDIANNNSLRTAPVMMKQQKAKTKSKLLVKILSIKSLA